jgi:choline dehydrogenase-like flavoprotein
VASDQLRAVFAAIARATTPDIDGPGLVGAVVEDVCTFVTAFPPTARAALQAGVAALQVGSIRPRFGMRAFTSLDARAAAQYLHWWDGRPLAIRRIAQLPRGLVLMAYYEQPSVRRRLGYDPDPWIAAVAAGRAQMWSDEIEAHRQLLLRPAPLRVARTSADPVGGARPAGAIRSAAEFPAGGVEVDVAIIGSGAGGSVVAAELAEAGLSVAVLEEGQHHRTEDFTSSTIDALRTLYRDGGASTTLGNTPIVYSEGRCVGGSTVINGAMAFRANERVLDRWCRISGVVGLPDDLDRHYARVERFLSVRTQDPRAGGRDQELLRAGADRLNWRVVEDQRAQVRCGGCNVCTWGCPTGAKQSTLVSYLPRAVAFGANVWTGFRVDRILMRGKRAVGVRGRAPTDHGEQDVDVHARRIVVCAGAIQTPALLARSGIRSPSGRIGHGLTVHPGAAITAVFDEIVDGWKGAHQTHQVREFEADGIVLAAVNLPPALVAWSLPMAAGQVHDAMADYQHMVTAGMLVEDTGSGRVRAVGRDTALATYRINERDTQSVLRATGLLGELLVAAGARTLYLPVDGMAPVSGMDALRRSMAERIPAERLTLSTVHLMGTAALGTDPMRAVCDPFGRVHDTDALYVADASLFPGPVGINPQLTVMALATRIAERMIDTW